MNERSDAQLLRDYAEHGDEAAFREIVVRHTDLVYSAALRQVGSPDLARDVAQSVFTDLAAKARSLVGKPGGESLAGWLYRGTRFAALNLLRDDRRRQARERQAMEHFDSASETAPDWDRVRPVLDEAMSNLSDDDREALLLRFFKSHDFRAIGQSLGVSDDAAQKRVSRALERLRDHLTSRGVTTGAVALSTVLSANAVTVAPAGLAATLSTAALAGTTTSVALTVSTATKAIAMTTIQKTLATITVAALAGVGIYQARQAAQLRGQVQTLQQQNEQLKTANDELTTRLGTAAEAPPPANDQNRELLRLRGEVGVLRRQKAEADQALAAAGNTQQRPATAPDRLVYFSPNEATKGIFESWGRGDWDAFFANFDLDGGRETWDRFFTDDVKNRLAGMEVVSIGEPTNSFASNMWFVPYTIRFKDGTEKSHRLHVAQNPRNQRWILKGGF